MPSREPLQHEIAKAMAVDVRTVRRWRDLDDYPHEAKSAAEVIEWANGKGLGTHKKQSRDLAAVKLLIAEQELQKKTRENQIAGREVLPIAESVEAAQKATQVWQSALKAKIETEAPSRLLGKDIAELRAELRIIHDELCAEVAKVFSESIPK